MQDPNIRLIEEINKNQALFLDKLGNESKGLTEAFAEEVKEDDEITQRIRQQSLPRVPYVRTTPKTGRNEKCHCGSEKKYKKCCYPN